MAADTMIQPGARLVLASTSPRRRDLLTRALGEGGFDVIDPGVDDGQLRLGGGVSGGPGGGGAAPPGEWVRMLAYLKARAGAERLVREGHARPQMWVLGADTLCAHKGEILGKPRDAADARAMLARLMNDRHDVLTGAALIPALQSPSQARGGIAGEKSLVDRAVSHLGPLTSEQLDSYIASGQWAGKAGAYNLEERAAAGWPIRAEGDPTCVVGLPMVAIEPWLRAFRAPADPRASLQGAAA
ncbi:MAG: Maf family protein [Phycisphaerales bacterium]